MAVIEVTYIEDECYPVYSLDWDSSGADGTVELSETFFREFQQAEDTWWRLQDELREKIKAQEKKKPRQKKRGK